MVATDLDSDTNIMSWMYFRADGCAGVSAAAVSALQPGESEVPAADQEPGGPGRARCVEKF